MTAFALALVVLPFLKLERVLALPEGQALPPASRVQLALFVLTGTAVLALAVVDLCREPDADTVLLLCWILGTVVFAGFVNWTVNGRSVMPLLPAYGILLARHWRTPGRGASTRLTAVAEVVALALAAAVSLLVARADYRLASTARTAASTIHQELAGAPGTHWFQGHWGFQYYMEELGWQPFDVRAPELRDGEVMAIPANNSNVTGMPKAIAAPVRFYLFPQDSGVATMSSPLGAGFYSDVWGPLPFVFGKVPPESYQVLRLRAPGEPPRAR